MSKIIFGDWIHNVDKLHGEFINNEPFSHIIINNFLKQEVAEQISTNFPEFSDKWWVYNNPIEVKYAYDKISALHPVTQDVFNALSSSEMIEKMCTLTGIKNLEQDPTLHGGGLHMHPKNGRLMMHLDYEKHPLLHDKQRRLNIILYLSKNWSPKWNGATELWDKNLTQKVKQSEVIFNKALIFQTTEQSWHGMPEKMLCPDNIFRKSLAFYYISPLINEKSQDKVGVNKDGYRTKAVFKLRPSDNQDPRIQKLLEIRPHRRITTDDMHNIYPEWDNTI